MQTRALENDVTVVLATRVDHDFVKLIKEEADKETRNLSNMIHVLLREALKARGVKL
jgi:hypothetical protein